jgi:hypothetical protein
MRRLSALLFAAAGLAALVAADMAAAQNTAEARCQTSRDSCDDKCGPIASGSPWDFGNGGGFEVNQQAIECRGKCKKTYDFCMRRAAIMANPPTAVLQGGTKRPPRPGLLDSAPGLAAQGPAATGAPVVAPAPPAGRIQ